MHQHVVIPNVYESRFRSILLGGCIIEVCTDFTNIRTMYNYSISTRTFSNGYRFSGRSKLSRRQSPWAQWSRHHLITVFNSAGVSRWDVLPCVGFDWRLREYLWLICQDIESADPRVSQSCQADWADHQTYPAMGIFASVAKISSSDKPSVAYFSHSEAVLILLRSAFFPVWKLWFAAAKANAL